MLRTNKITRILSLYYQLITGKPISKHLFCIEHNITERSFDRDIEDIRLFLSEEHAYCELRYDRQENMYYLSNIFGKPISGEVSFLLVDILFSMKILSKNEMEGILRELLEATEMHKNNELYNYILQKINLKNTWGSTAILKMHRDLERAINDNNLIEINYEISEENVQLRKIYPVQLKVDNGFIYLIAYIVDKQYNNPAFFRLDRIKKFTILHEQCTKDIKIKYLEKMKQINLYNMMAREEVEVTVKVQQDMKRVLNDVFPNCTLLKQDIDNNCIYKIKTYKQSFLSWVLAQEKEVIILEPKNMKNELIYRLKEKLRQYECGDD